MHTICGYHFPYRIALPVDKFEANSWGLKQMHGNVWEWCLDVYQYYNPELRLDPLVLAGSSPAEQGDKPSRVLRGGGWADGGQGCRSAFRSWVSEQGLRLTTDLDVQLRNLQLESTDAGYENVASELESIAQTLSAAKEQQLEDQSDRLLFLLKGEIRSRLLLDNDMVEADLSADGWVQQALDLVSSPRRVADILE